jgi:hypothetical protein
MKYTNTGRIAAADETSVTQDLDNAEKLIKGGGVLLGWTNQTTSPGTLAIGGGIASGIQPIAQKAKITSWVTAQ